MLRNGKMKRIIALLFVLVLMFSIAGPVYAEGLADGWRGGSPEGNQSLLEQLEQMVDSDTTLDELQQRLTELGVLNEEGVIETVDYLTVDGVQMTLDEARALLEAPDADMEAPVEVDGLQVTLGDLKTIIAIEDYLAYMRATYFDAGADMTPEHELTMEALLDQFNNEGMVVEAAEDPDAVYYQISYTGKGLVKLNDNTYQITMTPGQDIALYVDVYGVDAEGNSIRLESDSAAFSKPGSIDYRIVSASAVAGTHFTVTRADSIIEGTGTINVGRFTRYATEEVDGQTVRTEYYTLNGTNQPGMRVNGINGWNNLKKPDTRWNGTRSFIIQFYNPRGAYLYTGNPQSPGTNTLDFTTRIHSDFDWLDLAMDTTNGASESWLPPNLRNYKGLAKSTVAHPPILYVVHNQVQTIESSSGWVAKDTYVLYNRMLGSGTPTVPNIAKRLKDTFSVLHNDGIYNNSAGSGAKGNSGYYIEMHQRLLRSSAAPGGKNAIIPTLTMGTYSTNDSEFYAAKDYTYNYTNVVTKNRDPMEGTDIHYAAWYAGFPNTDSAPGKVAVADDGGAVMFGNWSPHEDESAMHIAPDENGNVPNAFAVKMSEEHFQEIQFKTPAGGTETAKSTWTHALLSLQNDGKKPFVKSVSAPEASFKTGQTIPIVVEFSEPVRCAYKDTETPIKAQFVSGTGGDAVIRELVMAENPATLSQKVTFLYAVPEGEFGTIENTTLEILPNAGAYPVNGLFQEMDSTRASGKVSFKTEIDMTSQFTDMKVQTTIGEPPFTFGEEATYEYLNDNTTVEVRLYTKDGTVFANAGVDLVDPATGRLQKGAVTVGEAQYPLYMGGVGIEEGSYFYAHLPLRALNQYATNNKIQPGATYDGFAVMFTTSATITIIPKNVPIDRLEWVDTPLETTFWSSIQNIGGLQEREIRVRLSPKNTTETVEFTSDDIGNTANSVALSPKAEMEVDSDGYPVAVCRVSLVVLDTKDSRVRIRAQSASANPVFSEFLKYHLKVSDDHVIQFTNLASTEFSWPSGEDWQVSWRDTAHAGTISGATATIQLFQGKNPAAESKPVYEVTTGRRQTLSHTVPGEALQATDAPQVYTLRISHTLPGENVLPAEAVITVLPPLKPVRARLQPLENTAYVYSGNLQVPLKWTLEDYADGVCELEITKNGKTCHTIDITDLKDYPLTPAPLAGGLKDTYVVTLRARNSGDPEGYMATDSLTVRVYDDGWLNILVGEALIDQKLSLENDVSVGNVPSFGDALNLHLAESVTVDTLKGSLGTLSDTIQWTSSEQDIASVNFKSSNALKYQSVETLKGRSFSPYSDFIITGNGNGKAEIKVTHQPTGITDTLPVEVTTLRNRLYLFQCTPAVQTTVQYTTVDDVGESKTVKMQTDTKGRLVVYEKNGITGTVSMRSTYEGTTYTGAVAKSNLVSGEGRMANYSTYQVNTVVMKQASRLQIYLKNPDGTPFSGKIDLRGAVTTYPADGSEGKTVNVSSVYTDDIADRTKEAANTGLILLEVPEGDLGNLGIGDRLDFTVEVLTLEDLGYYPILFTYSMVVGHNTNRNFGAVQHSFAVVPEAEKNKPYIVQQRVDLGIEGVAPMVVTSGNVGPSRDYTEPTLESMVSWWGASSPSALADTSLFVESESLIAVGKEAQSSMLLNLSFTDTPYMVNKTILSADALKISGIKDLSTSDMVLSTYDADGNFVSRMNAPVCLVNAPTLPAPSESKQLEGDFKAILSNVKETNNLNSGNFSGGHSDNTPPADGTAGLMMEAGSNLSVDLPYISVMIVPTEDPLVYRAVGKVSASFGDSGGEYGVSFEHGDIKSELKIEPDIEELMELTTPAGLAKAVAPVQTELGATISSMLEFEITYDEEAGRFRNTMVGGGVDVIGEANVSLSINQQIAFIPIVINLEVGGEMAYNMRAVRPMDTSATGGTFPLLANDFYNVLRVSIYTEAFAGLGFDYNIVALKAGIFGRLQYDFTGYFLNRPYLTSDDAAMRGFDIGLDGQVGLKFVAKLLFVSFESTWTTYSFQEDLYTTGQVNAIKRWLDEQDAAILEMNGETMGIIAGEPEIAAESRAYLDAEASPTDLDLVVDPLAEPASIEELLLTPQEDGALGNTQYPYAYPRLTRDGSISAFISDQNFADLNATRVEYFIDNQEAQPISPPGEPPLADSELSLDGTRKHAVAAWVRQRDTLPEQSQLTTIDASKKMLNDTEIYASVYAGGAWETTRITSNNTPDMAPVVAASASRAILAWRSPTGRGLTEDGIGLRYDDLSDSIWFTLYDGQSWQTQQLLYLATDGVGSVKGLSAAMIDDTSACIVYSVDAVGNGEPEDYEIRMAVLNLKAPAEKMVVANHRLTNDDLLDENPQVTVVQLYGEACYLAGWHTLYEDNVSDIRFHVVDRDGQDYNDKIAGESGKSGFLASLAKGDPSANYPANFSFVRNENADLDRLHVVYPVNGVAGGEVYATRFSTDGGQISASIPFKVAEAPGFTIDHVAASLMGAEVIVMMQTSAFNDQGVNEGAMRTGSAELTNTFSFTIEQPSSADIQPGVLLQLGFTVKNEGYEVIDEVVIKWPEADDILIDTKIMPGDSAILRANHLLPTEVANIKDTGVKLEARFGSEEVVESEGMVHLAVPDLEVSDLKVVLAQDGKRVVEAQLANQSVIPVSSAMKAGLYTSANAVSPVVEATLTEDELVALNEGHLTKQFTYTLPKGGIPDEGIDLYVCIEALQEERNTTNNSGLLSVTNPMLENGGYPIQVTVDDQYVKDGKTTAVFTIRNLSMQRIPENTFRAILMGQATGSGQLPWVDFQSHTIEGIAPEAVTTQVVEFNDTGNSIQAGITPGVYRPAAPAITANLTANKQVNSGAPLTLSVAATEPEYGLLSYQWYKDNDKIRGATRPSLTLGSFGEADAGDYYVVVTNTLSTYTAKTRSNICQVTLPAPVPTAVALGMRHLVLAQNDTVNIPIITSGTPALETTVSQNSGRVQLNTKVNGDKLCVTAMSGENGTVTVQVRDKNNPGAMAECRVDVIASRLTPPPYQKLNFAANTLTSALYREQNSVIELVRGTSGAGNPWSLMNGDYTVEMEAANPKNQTAFEQLTQVYKPELEILDESRLALQWQNNITSAAEAATLLKKSSYAVKLVLKEGGVVVAEDVFPGKLTLKINKKPPAIKAGALVLNTFMNQLEATPDSIAFSGGTVTALRLDGTRNDRLLKSANPWLRVSTDANGYLTSLRVLTTAKKSGTLRLLASVEGWSSPVPVSLTVRSVSAAPAVKLAKTKVSLYGDPNSSIGVDVQMVPKSSKQTLAGISVTGLHIATTDELNALVVEGRLKEKTRISYTLNAEDCGYQLTYNGEAGKYRLSVQKDVVESGKLLLLADTKGGKPVLLPLTVAKTATTKKLTVKPNLKKVSLNPALSDSYDIQLTPNIADYALAGMEMSWTVDKSGLAEPVKVGAQTLRVAATPDTPYNSSYTVSITFTDPKDESRTVKTSVKVSTPRKAVDPKVSLSVKGRVDLTTGEAATVTAKISNYMGTYNTDSGGAPSFAIYDKAGKLVYDQTNPALGANFEVVATSPSTWSVRLAKGGRLSPGTYKIGIVSGTVGRAALSLVTPPKMSRGATVAHGNFTFLTVRATKPKPSVTPKATTLYKADPQSRQVFVPNLGYSAAQISHITLKDADSESMYFGLTTLSDGRIAIGFKNSSAENALQAKTRTLTLNVFLKSNAAVDKKGSPVPAATLKVKVTVK